MSQRLDELIAALPESEQDAIHAETDRLLQRTAFTPIQRELIRQIARTVACEAVARFIDQEPPIGASIAKPQAFPRALAQALDLSVARVAEAEA